MPYVTKREHRLTHRLLYDIFATPHLNERLVVPDLSRIVLDYMYRRPPSGYDANGEEVFAPDTEAVRFALVTLKKFMMAGIFDFMAAERSDLVMEVVISDRPGRDLCCAMFQFAYSILETRELGCHWVYVSSIDRPVFHARAAQEEHIDDGWRIVFAEMAHHTDFNIVWFMRPTQHGSGLLADHFALRVAREKPPRVDGTRQAYDFEYFSDSDSEA